MSFNFSQLFSLFETNRHQVERLEGEILRLEQKMDELIQVQRNHLIRVKNHEEIPDEFLYQGQKYHDLSPEKAWRLYNDKDFDFTLLDVSAKSFSPTVTIPEAIKISLEELPERFIELQNKSTPLLIISEDGTNSILACEFLTKRGYYNCNNISGGYRFWKASELRLIKELSA